MKVAIHQPHYFPWMGYFDKMAKADAFVILDEVQLEKSSNMIRNRVVCNGEIKFLNIAADTNGFLQRSYSDICVKNEINWKEKQLNAIENYYRKADFFNQGYELLETFLGNEYTRLFEWTYNSILLIKNLLQIDTKLILQSGLEYEKDKKQSELVQSICKVLNADVYLSGSGASKDYLNRESFENDGIKIEFQQFNHPIYKQLGTSEFISGLSILDCIFNIGIEETKKVFWDNIH